ncbi:MAG: type II toxin-antitoxin system VapC family toxin [Tagaea sp.]|nr:type II toxin-antitoxin system VapC family toxin [Tagaea sp.]
MNALFVDSSAIVEILSGGQEEMDCRAKLAASPILFSSPTVYLESGLVMVGGRHWQRGDFEFGYRSFDFIEIPIDAEIGRLALDAFERYGKGRHKAKLNFGDCLSYATARRHGLALLYVGRDFAATDVARA